MGIRAATVPLRWRRDRVESPKATGVAPRGGMSRRGSLVEVAKCSARDSYPGVLRGDHSHVPWRRGRFPRPCGSGNSKSRTARPCMTPLRPDASQPANRPTAAPTTRCSGTAVASPHHSHHRRRVACQRGVVVGEERRRTRRQIRFLWRLLRFRLCGWRWRRISTLSGGNNGTLFPFVCVLNQDFTLTIGAVMVRPHCRAGSTGR